MKKLQYLILEGEEYYKKHYGNEKSIFKLHPTIETFIETTISNEFYRSYQFLKK